MHDQHGPVALRQAAERTQGQSVRTLRGQAIVWRGGEVLGVELTAGYLAPAALEEVARDAPRDSRQPGPQRTVDLVVRPAPPHDEEDLLCQILGVVGGDAVPPQRTVHVVELRLEGSHAMGEWRGHRG